MKYDSVYLFSSNNICFAKKEPIKVKVFGSFECLCQNLSNFSCQFWNGKSIPLQILHHSSVSWNMTPCTYLAPAIYTLLKRNPLKLNFLGLLSACVKICQIPHVNFETASQFLFKFCIIFQCHERCLLFTFLAQRICTLLQRCSLKWKFFETFECLGQNLSNSSCQVWNDKSFPL